MLYCYRCGQYFSCNELGHCNYHPMTADFSNVDCTATKIVGVYPCCQQKVLHFDPSSETSVSLKGSVRVKTLSVNEVEISNVIGRSSLVRLLRRSTRIFPSFPETPSKSWVMARLPRGSYSSVVGLPLAKEPTWIFSEDPRVTIDKLISSFHSLGFRFKFKYLFRSVTSLERPIRPALISGFCSMKRLGVFLLPPGWDAALNSPVPIYTPGWREVP